MRADKIISAGSLEQILHTFPLCAKEQNTRMAKQTEKDLTIEWMEQAVKESRREKWKETRRIKRTLKDCVITIYTIMFFVVKM